MISGHGFQNTFLYFGIGQGIIICVLAFLMFAPLPGQVPAVTGNANVIQTRRQYRSQRDHRQLDLLIVGQR